MFSTFGDWLSIAYIEEQLGSLGFQSSGFKGLYRGYIRLIYGLYTDNGKANGNHYLEFWV